MPQLSPMSWTLIILVSLFFLKLMSFGSKKSLKVQDVNLTLIHKKWSW